MSKKLFLLLYILHDIETSVISVGPLVVLPDGLIQGREDVTITNKTYYAFEKIPYASPPVGNLRFKPPIPPQHWEDVLNTTHLDVSCYQLGSDGVGESEDCLFINVYTPQLPGSESTIPVMIFIHGGGFIEGSSMEYHSDLIVEKDVVYVSFNYRLGIFGFLSTQDNNISGNFGLKDQQLAIQWTYNNIHLFGGDPEKITIFGQSAGSVSVCYQLLNQKNKGLFRGAILQSGSCISPWGLQRNARTIAFDTAAYINKTFSNSDDSAALLDFLQSVDAVELNAAAAKYKSSHASFENMELYQGLFWAPVIEPTNQEAFITDKMYGLIDTGNTLQIPIIIGTTSEEFIGLSEYNTLDYVTSSFQAYDEHLDWLVPNDTQISDQTNRTEVGRLIKEIYTGGEPFAEYLGDGVRFLSDNGFTRSIIKTADLYSRFAKTWYYQFSYDGQIGPSNIRYDGAESVGHSADLFYLFCFDTKCDFSKYPQDDQDTVTLMVSLWTNFAKYLNPTPDPTKLLDWPTVSTDDGTFYYLNINQTFEIKNWPKNETYSQWIKIYDSLGIEFDTY